MNCQSTNGKVVQQGQGEKKTYFDFEESCAFLHRHVKEK